jgi:Natural resistance-associated macrophage protein
VVPQRRYLDGEREERQQLGQVGLGRASGGQRDRDPGQLAGALDPGQVEHRGQVVEQRRVEPVDVPDHQRGHGVVLVISQVILSFGIPFALVPLILLTRRADVMGSLVNQRLTTVVAGLIATLIISLNVYLLAVTFVI